MGKSFPLEILRKTRKMTLRNISKILRKICKFLRKIGKIFEKIGEILRKIGKILGKNCKNYIIFSGKLAKRILRKNVKIPQKIIDIFPR